MEFPHSWPKVVYSVKNSANFDDVGNQEKKAMLQILMIVQSAVDGYNVCIFANGQTCSGKTFIKFASENNPGLTPLATSELFKILKRDGNKFSFSLKAYMLELYQDTLVDLLLPKQAKRSNVEIKKTRRECKFKLSQTWKKLITHLRMFSPVVDSFLKGLLALTAGLGEKAQEILEESVPPTSEALRPS
ncbi:hypothetical protein L1987_18026 [Smallanthus sonchifolius]|uniref:Uncharacterized protein n=1 Tax=Smallanthus sonchifolius TaxID=185202 RepID=A0ACB9IZM0_9ASTR|nr:hypothetical protein L1987_18026 [Smallanthus sonchifolius]